MKPPLRSAPVALLALLMAAAMATTTGLRAEPDPVAAGHAIFANGQGPGPACANCHGRDGLGGGEGETPPVDWPALSVATPARSAYDAAAFARALREGRGADGRILSRLMPRYELDADQVAALAAYLRALPDLQRQGVASGRLRIGVFGDAYLAALRAALGDQPIHGRGIELVPLPRNGPLPADSGLLAVIGPRAASLSAARQAAEQGIPVLFPLAPLTGGESPSIIRSLIPSERAAMQYLADQMAAEGPASVIVQADPADDFADRLAAHLRVALARSGTEVQVRASGGRASDVVLWGEAAPLPAGLRRIWSFSVPAPEALAAAPDAAPRVILTAPMIIGAAMETGQPTLRIHAGLAARLLSAALMQAGRDVTRTGLMQAFAQMPPPVPGLDFSRQPLTGTDRLQIIVIGR